METVSIIVGCIGCICFIVAVYLINKRNAKR